MRSNLALELDFDAKEEISVEEVIAAWKGRRFRQTLPPNKLRQLPNHPVGAPRLAVVGGTAVAGEIFCSSDNCSSSNCSSSNCSSDNCSSSNCSSSNCSGSNCSTDNCSSSNCSGQACSAGICGMLV